MCNTDREQVAQGALILHRLVPAPDHGAGFRRDPETGIVYYSSEWLNVMLCPICKRQMEPLASTRGGICREHGFRYPDALSVSEPSE